MKRLMAILLALCLVFCACTDAKPAQKESLPKMSADELARNIISYLGLDAGEMEHINSLYDGASLEAFIEGYYGFLSEGYTDCAIYRKGGAEAFEITVFIKNEQADNAAVKKCLEAYRLERQGDFFGYAPEQANIVENSFTCIYGDYAAVLICENADYAQEVFMSLLKGEEPKPMEKSPEAAEIPRPEETSQPTESPAPMPVPTEIPTYNSDGRPDYWKDFISPGKDNMNLWDSAQVVAAVKARSGEGLNKKDIKLYEATVKILDNIIAEGMTELEMEWAVYSWLVSNTVYDYRHYDVPNSAPRDSYKPHGPIVEGTAVCLGYAAAFQFFMDILDIECITVVGAAFNSYEDHAWNMVCLDGKWYCVDATWEPAGLTDMDSSIYFNVSSDLMAKTDHQWDYDNTPLAE